MCDNWEYIGSSDDDIDHVAMPTAALMPGVAATEDLVSSDSESDESLFGPTPAQKMRSMRNQKLTKRCLRPI